MTNSKQGSEVGQFLSMIGNLLESIGSEKNNLSMEINKFFEHRIENKHEKAIVDSILCQLQKINEQMENMGWLNKHYRILHDFAQICSKTLNENILLKKTFELVSQVMPSDSFYIAYYTEGEPLINLLFLVDFGNILTPRAIEFGDNYTSEVIRTRKIIHQKTASQAQEYDMIIGEETSSTLFVPVVIDDQVKGVISTQSNKDFAYRKEHEDLLQLIGTQVINSVETARLYDKIFLMSQTDELTGLKNHRAFHNDLSMLINGENPEITLVMIDSDGLKKVNDNYGHDIGDMYLKVLAAGIKSLGLDERIEGYRYAGDEFMIIIKSRMTNVMDQLHERLKEYFLHNAIHTSKGQLIVSFSSGVAYYPDHGPSVDTLKKSADTALYRAKETSGNQIVIAK